MDVHTFVCGVGADVFRQGGEEYPCGSRWVRMRDAAVLLGRDPQALVNAIGAGAVPTDWRGWVSLDWVEGILKARERAA